MTSKFESRTLDSGVTQTVKDLRKRCLKFDRQTAISKCDAPSNNKERTNKPLVFFYFFLFFGAEER